MMFAAFRFVVQPCFCATWLCLSRIFYNGTGRAVLHMVFCAARCYWMTFSGYQVVVRFTNAKNFVKQRLKKVYRFIIDGMPFSFICHE